MADITATPGAAIASNTPQAIIDNRADFYTFFTVAGGTKLLLSVPQWTKITLRLETAGPVAVGTREQLDPVASGKGRLLPTDEDVVMMLGPNTRFFYAATGLQRVAIHVEAVPWLQAIFEALRAIHKVTGSGGGRAGTSAPALRRGC